MPTIDWKSFIMGVLAVYLVKYAMSMMTSHAG